MTGFGESKEMEYPYSVDDYVKEIRGVIDALGVEKIDVVAHSFGARVLVKLLAVDNRVDKIILTGAAGLKKRKGIKYYFRRGAFIILRKFLPKDKLKVFYSPDYLCLSPVMKKSFRLIIDEDLTSYYRRIKNRALIIFGASDRETPVRTAKRMKKLIKGSKLQILPNSGHFCFCEKPDEFNSKAFIFLMEK